MDFETLRISVVIPHLNQPIFLARCLESLANGTLLADEIFVVDNGSEQMPEAVCAAHDNVTLLRETEPGPGPARNLGVAHSTGDVLAFIDADCLAHPDWLATAAREMADPTAEILGGDVRIAIVDHKRTTALESYEGVYAYRMDRYIEREGFTGTGNLVVRRQVLDAVGPFAGLSLAEDRDWGQRATAAGYVIRYVAAMKAYHPARETFAELRKKWDRQMAHDFGNINSSKDRLRWLAKTLAMPLTPAMEIPRILSSDRITGPTARLQALAVLARIRFYRTKRMVQLFAGLDPDRLSGKWNRP